MVQSKDDFPFDLRSDNIRLNGNELVVIDFSEGGVVVANPSFAKDSLLEFWRKKTKLGKSKITGEYSRAGNRLQTLLDNAAKENCLPLEMSRNPKDCDSTSCDLILDNLDENDAAAPLAPGKAESY